MKPFIAALTLLCSISISLAQDIPDFFLGDIVPDQSSVNRGESITIDFTLSSDIEFNQSVRVFAYLSDDQVFGTGDQAIMSALFSTGENSLSLSIPTDTEIGQKFIILAANQAFVIRESDYSNNTATSNTPIDITEEERLDISIDALVVTTIDDVVAGLGIATDITVSSTAAINNLGIEYFISSDDIHDTDDVYLGSLDFAALSMGSTFFTHVLDIPSATDPGTWNIIAFADGDGRFGEVDETNNIATIEIIVEPIPALDYTFLGSTMAEQVTAGDNPSVSFFISEEENSITDLVKVSMYLSTDSTFSTDDKLLFVPQSQVPGEDVTRNVVIPEDTPAGFYQLMLVVDPDLEIKETDEINNVRPHRIEVIRDQDPDLTFKDIFFPTTLASGVTYPQEFYSIENLTGVSAFGTHLITFYLSTDSILDENDYLLTSKNEQLPATQPFELNTELTVDKGIEEGDYLLLSFVDFLDEYVEQDETNNDTILQVTVINPDLIVSNFNTDATISGAGQSFDAEVNVTNQNGFAAPSNLSFFLSSDETLDDDDPFLLTTEVGSLNPGESLDAPIPLTFTIPNLIEAGDYFVLAYIDSDSSIVETDETNNIGTIPIEIILPDLEIKSPIVNPSTITAGLEVTLGFRVDNNAATPAPASNVKLFLSEDESYDLEDDYFLGQQAIEAITAEDKSTDKEVTVSIPVLEAGDYKILFVADPDSLISESDEANNLSTSDITLTNPDLLPANLELAKDLVGSGEDVDLSFIFTNQGNGTLSPTQYRVYLAGDKLEEEVFITSGNSPSLDPSESSNLFEVLFDMPAYVDSGTYYLRVEADYFDSVLESDETNNADSIQIQVTNPDLTLSGIIASPSVISVGFPTRIEIDVENIGKVNAAPTSLRYVLSSDEIVDENDFFYSLQNIAGIDSLKELEVERELIIPTFLNSGDYFVIVQVDPLDLLPEVDEENNTTSVPVSVKVPDLEILNEDSDQAVVGISEELMVEARVRNLSGDAKSPSSVLGYYLSEDDALDDEDTYLGGSQVEVLELSGTSSKAEFTFIVPQDRPAGDYHIIFVADNEGIVNEADENNNEAALPIEITNPDLVPSNFVLSKSSVMLQEQISVTVQIDNEGVSQSPAGFISFYLSTREVLNDSSRYLGARNFNLLAPAEDTVLENTAVTIPPFLVPSDYFVLGFVDDDSLIAEMNEANNIISEALTILYPDLTTINQELDEPSVQVGDTLTVSYNLKNDGDVESQLSSTGFYFQNQDTTLLLSQYSRNEPVLEAFGTSSQVEVELVVPITVPPGDYQLVIEVDQFDNNVESDEDNNSFELDVEILPMDFEVVNGFANPSLIEPDSTNMVDQFISYVLEVKSSVDISQVNQQFDDILRAVSAYLSVDDTYDENDRPLSSLTAFVLSSNPEDSIFISRGTVSFPYDVAEGDYFVVFQFDKDSLVSEADEANNFYAVPVTYGEGIRPDLLAVDQQIIPAKFTRGKDVKAVRIVTNDGKTDISGSFTNRVFLSDDELLGDEDLLLQADTIETIEVGEELSIVSYFNISEDLTSGDKNVFGANDDENEFAEQDEENNNLFTAISYYDPLPLDFSTTCSSSLPELIRSGDRITLAYEVENLGSSIPSGDLATSIYFSTDEQLSSDDSLLWSSTSTAVSQHELLSYVNSVQIPNELDTDTYYLLIRTDDEELFDETDETNNLLTVALNVQEALLPDLLFEIQDVNPTTIEANSSFNVLAKVTNLGGTNLPDVSLGFYLSKVNVFSSEAIFLENIPSALSVDAYSDESIFIPTVSVPQDVEPGAYFLLVKVDDDELIVESSEQNNIAIEPVTIDGAIVPDFTLSNNTPTLTLYQGEISGNSYSVSHNLSNLGTKSDVVDVAAYFSLDDVYDEQDIFLDERTELVANIFGGSTFNTIGFELPDLLAGEYTVFAVVDPEDEIFELDETNNIVATSVTVFPPSRPDLTTEDGLSLVSNSVGINGILEITQLVRNLDRLAVDSAKVSFYLSNDPTISGGDLLLAETITPAIAGFANRTISQIVTIPTSVSQGDYFLIAEVDPDNKLDESDESNNEEFLALSITEAVQPDLVAFFNTLGSTSFSANTDLSASYFVQNDGDGPVEEYEVGFYLSKNDVIDDSDILVNVETNGIIKEGESKFIQTTLFIPQSADPGDYNLIISADPNDLIDETSEDNNEDFVAVTVLEPEPADLIGLFTVNPGFVNARELVTANFTIQNQGFGVAGESNTKFYLSEDELFDTSDVLLADTAISTISASSSVSLTIQLTIPDVASGDYVFIGIVDADDSVDEADEENNDFTIGVEIGDPIFPDLTITQVMPEEERVNAGNNLEFSMTVENIGEALSMETTVDFYLSTEASVNGGAIFLGDGEVPQIASSASVLLNFSFTVPEATNIGDYFILAEVNPDNTLEESNVSNNTGSSPIEVLERLLPDLEINFASVQPEEIPAGQEGNISFSIFNFGDGQANTSEADVYLSSDENLDSNDVLLATVSVGSIDFGQSEITQANFTIDRTTAVGSYSLIVEIDANNDVEESNESNNLFFVDVVVLEEPKADLIPGSLAFNSSTINAGGTLGVSFELFNIGDIASQAGEVGVYFSEDNALDGSDELITTLTTTVLNAGDGDFFSTSVPIPLEEVPGDYFILVNADEGGIETELDEENNLISGQIEVTNPLPGNLTISEVSLSSSSIFQNEDVTATVAVANPSSNAVLPSTVGIYLSTDQSISTDDLIVDAQAIGVLAGQANETLTFTLNFQDLVSAGEYFLIARADSNQEIDETDENDNDEAIAITLMEALGIEEGGLTLFPNPTVNFLTIRTELSGTKEVKVFDLIGRKIINEEYHGGEFTLDVSSLIAGEYLVSVSDGKEEITLRFIKE